MLESRMREVRFSDADLRDPMESADVFVKIEPAPDCDGLACGATAIPFDVLGQYPKPHFHSAVRGENPAANPRYIPLFECP